MLGEPSCCNERSHAPLRAGRLIHRPAGQLSNGNVACPTCALVGSIPADWEVHCAKCGTSYWARPAAA